MAAKKLGSRSRVQRLPILNTETNHEFVRFLRYAKRSCTEVQSELCMAVDQQYITKAEFHDVYDHAGRTRATIRGFIKYLLSYEQSRQNQP